MSPRKTILAVTLSVLVALAASAYFLRTQLLDALHPERNYNVLLISIDAARADRLPFNGYQGRLTPNIDRLVETALVFKQAYCYSGSTPPSMAAIFSSKMPYWPPDGPIWDAEHIYGLSRFFRDEALRPGIPSHLETLPTIFRAHGYTTVGISTNPYLTKEFHFHRGFDHFEEFSSQLEDFPYAGAERVTEKLQPYLSELRNDKFFAWIHFMDLHHPLVGYAPFLDKARDRRAKTEHSAWPVSKWNEKARQGMRFSYEQWRLHDWADTEEGQTESLEAYMLAYDAELVRIDEQIGIIMDMLRQYGLLENTVVAVVNDHGDAFMEHGGWTHDGTLYQQIVRGLWIMSNPTLFPHSEFVEERVGHLDFAPTLLDLIGRQAPESFDGVSQKASRRATPDVPDDFVFGLLGHRAYAIEGDHKLIVWSNPESLKETDGGFPYWLDVELYNLSQDPGEQRNVAQEHPEVAERLFVKLRDAFLRKGIDFWAPGGASKDAPSGRPAISKETEDRLRSLGYTP